ncbi:hypothetical protein CBL_13155 [Carabus blaptoides fortunei]
MYLREKILIERVFKYSGNETSEEYPIDLEAYNESLRNFQDMLFYLESTESQSKVVRRAALIIVPVPKVEVKVELSKFEGTLRERCKMRKKTSRRRREFEAAKARQGSS